jgi:hypothetical protein
MMGEETVDLLKQILEEMKKQTETLEDVKNLFAKYDQDLLLEEEDLRNG